jgi:putative endonuclease
MYFTYILVSSKDGKYYYGSTSDIEKRLSKHNKGDVRSTKNRMPLSLYYKEEYNTRSEAFQREQFFKTINGYNWLKENRII